MHGFDQTTGVIFYSQVGINGLGCWNPNTPHSPQNFDILVKDNRTMIYPTDVEVSKMTLNHSYNNKKKSIKNSFTHLLQNQLD